MLNKLRWKFVLINMILVTLVLTIVFTAVLASSYHRLEMDGVQAMERVLREGDTAFPKREIGGKLPGGKAPQKMMTAAFYVELDGGGAVQRVVGENVTVMDNGALKRPSYRPHAHKEKPPALSVAKACAFSSRAAASAFADRAGEIASLTSLLKTSALVGLFGLLAFFGISLFLARWALRPLENHGGSAAFVADASHELKTPLTVILANMGSSSPTGMKPCRARQNGSNTPRRRRPI